MPRFRFADRSVTLVGVLNVTPDSFSDGGQFEGVARAVAHGRALMEQGADLVDVGGESTRPHATPVSIDVEIGRVVPVIRELHRHGVPTSIDSRHPEVVAAALDEGACVVNDVGGLRSDEMVRLAAEHGAPAIAMHMPFADLERTHGHASSGDVVGEVREFLALAARRALEGGVPEVVVDPGLGFGKTVDDNVRLIRSLKSIVELGHPVLVGGSRKRFVGALTGIERAADRDEASVVVHLAAVRHGASALRVHDVARHRRALDLWTALDG